MCTTKDSGCGCDEPECPADGADDQPQCSDTTCAGKDGQCTAGQYEGCNCDDEECPDMTKVSFWCSECGGKGADGKCKGVKKTEYIPSAQANRP